MAATRREARLRAKVTRWLGSAGSPDRVEALVTLGPSLVHRQDVQQLATTLLSGEEVLVAGYGGPTSKLGLVVLTDQRVLSVQGRIYSSPGHQEVRRDDVIAVDQSVGRLKHRLTLHVVGRELEISVAPATAAQRLVDDLRGSAG